MGPREVDDDAMMHPVTRRRRVFATSCVAATLAALVLAGSATGQSVPPPPSSEAAVNAYFAVRQWLDGYDLPAPDDPASSVPLDDAGGVCVIIRRSGRVVATGTSAGEDGTRATWHAASRAFGELQGGPMRELPEMLQVEAARALTLEVEVAGRLQPMLGRGLDDLGPQLEPGIDGLGLRVGEQIALSFPAELRSRNAVSGTGHLVPALAGELGVRELDGILDRPDVQIYRFRTVHLAQREIGRTPSQLYRGQAIVPDDAVSTLSIRELTDLIADRVIRVLPHDGTIDGRRQRLGIKGDYDPVTDSFDPAIARPLEQALMALALGRYSNVPGAVHAEAAHQLAIRIIQDLAVVEPVEDSPLDDPVTSAAVALAVIEIPGVEGDPAIRAMFSGSIETVTAAVAGVTPTLLSPHGRALIASAMSRLLKAGALPAGDAPKVRNTIDGTWASTPEPQQIGLLPWIGWAELDYARATGSMSGDEKLRLLRAFLDRTRSGGDAHPDTRGGFALTGGETRRPTAQSLRPASFTAAMLREPSLTAPHEVSVALGRHLVTVRYVMQLTVRTECSWALRNPDQAVGGVRAATWDRSQPAAAQALGLLTMAETMLSLEAIRSDDP